MRFALRAVRFCRTLPPTWEARHIGEQLFRSTTSVAANYRATCRARSVREFISKIGIVAEEADESVFWLTLLEQSEIATGADLRELLRETQELLAIFIASAKTAAANRDRSS
jgi:four helix bundle protein